MCFLHRPTPLNITIVWTTSFKQTKLQGLFLAIFNTTTLLMHKIHQHNSIKAGTQLQLLHFAFWYSAHGTSCSFADKMVSVM